MYGKYFASTYTGSMVGAGADVFAVWGYVIANTVSGQVELNPRYLAPILGMSEESIEKAVSNLCQPDPHSRSKVFDGKRLIREGQFAYRVPTYFTYRGIRNEDDRREYNRIKKQEQRQRDKNKGVKDYVIDSQRQSTMSTMSAQAEAEEEEETYKSNTTAGKPARKLAHQIPENFQPTEYHKKIADERHVDLNAEFEQFKDFHGARGSTFKDWNLALNTWIRNAAKYARNGGNGNGNGRLSPSESRSQRSQQVLDAAFGLGKNARDSTASNDNQLKNRTRRILGA